LNRNAPRGNKDGMGDAMQRGEGMHNANPKTINTENKHHEKPNSNRKISISER
jgi:hypothetical protein